MAEEQTHLLRRAALLRKMRWVEDRLEHELSADIEALLPRLGHPEYYTEPSIEELALRELGEKGFCSRVPNFVVGRKGYGSLRFLGPTDVRHLHLDKLVQFNTCEVVVYDDENDKPPPGYGLNKPAQVTLLNVFCPDNNTMLFVEKLKHISQKKGAQFVSYNALTHEWKFRVKHFSRFGLADSDDDDEDVGELQPGKAMVVVEEEAIEGDMLEEDIDTLELMNPEMQSSEGGLENGEMENSPIDGIRSGSYQSALPHSLPTHLRLDPLKMHQMKMLLFPTGEEEMEDIVVPRLMMDWGRQPQKLLPSSAANSILQQSPEGGLKVSAQKPTFSKRIKMSPPASWQRSPVNRFQKTSLELSRDLSPLKPSKLLLSLDSKSDHFISRRSRMGFVQELSVESCLSGRTGYVVDAALFLGNSFGVGWGPHGMLLHSGRPMGQKGFVGGLSSLVHIEMVALDATVRDEHGEVRDDLVDLQFVSPLRLHMSMSKFVDRRIEREGSLMLRYLGCNKLELSNACSEYEDLIVKQHAVEGLSRARCLVLRHQVMVWHVLKVLFSEKVADETFFSEEDPYLGTLDEMKLDLPGIDPEFKNFSRRADFSCWLQDSISHLIEDEVASLTSADHLKEIFSLLTGRQLDDAVQIAAFRGDVRLACLLSQAGGSMINRQDVASQFDTWSKEGLDYSLIEEERLQIFKLLSGDVQGALGDREIDWKRFLGLLMWYHLPPDTKLSEIIDFYSQLVVGQLAPQPIPMYIEEGDQYGLAGVSANGLYDTAYYSANGLYDTAYYLMLLHASKEKERFDPLKMFSSFTSSFDALDHRMAWLQKGLLQAIGVLGPLQLHVLDMNFVAQLLSVGLCHWAIYVILHMPPSLDHPNLHEKAVKEILNQYCEIWSSMELQYSFLEKDLGIPSEWLHEALGTYLQYTGELYKALEHYCKSRHWHKAHSLLMTSVAASLFFESKHIEVMKFATELEMHKAELDNWDLGGGVYIDFYNLKNSFEDSGLIENLGSLEQKAAICRSFFKRLEKAQELWANHSAESRFVYSKMADELSALLLAEGRANMVMPLPELKLYDAVLDAPLPEDIRACRLQGAVMAFTSWISEATSS